MSSSATSGSVLTAQSPEPALNSLSRSVSALPPLTLCLCLSQKYFFKKRPGQEQKGRWAERSVPQELLPSEPEALETEQNDVFCLLILLVWKVLSVLLRRVV